MYYTGTRKKVAAAITSMCVPHVCGWRILCMCSVIDGAVTGGLKYLANTDWFKFSKRTSVVRMKSCSSCVFNTWCDRVRNRKFHSPVIVLTEVAKKQPSEQPSELMGTLCRWSLRGGAVWTCIQKPVYIFLCIVMNAHVANLGGLYFMLHILYWIWKKSRP